MFLPGKASFRRFGSLGSGDFASNSASKIVETSSTLGWKRLQRRSCGNCCEREEKWGSGLEWLGKREMRSAMTLSVVEMRSAWIPTGLLIMSAAWRKPRAFPAADFLAPLRIQASEATLSVKKRAVGNGSLSLGASRKTAVVAT